jgi:hypothetical protein
MYSQAPLRDLPQCEHRKVNCGSFMNVVRCVCAGPRSVFEIAHIAQISDHVSQGMFTSCCLLQRADSCHWSSSSTTSAVALGLHVRTITRCTNSREQCRVRDSDVIEESPDVVLVKSLGLSTSEVKKWRSRVVRSSPLICQQLHWYKTSFFNNTSPIASGRIGNKFKVAFKATLRKMTNFQIDVVSDTVCRELHHAQNHTISHGLT